MRAALRLLRAHWGKAITLVLGIGLILGGSYYLVYQYQFAKAATHTNGTVISVEARTGTGGKGTTYCPVVTFLTERRQPVQFTSFVCSSSAPNIGSTIEVLYDPNDPQNAKLDTTSDRLLRWGLGGGPIVIGLLVVIGSIRGIARTRTRGQAGGDRVQDTYIAEPPTGETVSTPASLLGRFGLWSSSQWGELTLVNGVVSFTELDAPEPVFSARIDAVNVRFPMLYFSLGLQLYVSGKRYSFWFIPLRSARGDRAMGGGVVVSGTAFDVADMGPARTATRLWRNTLSD